MKKSKVIAFFGGVTNTAVALECTKQAVSGWGDVVPEGVAYKAHYVSDYKLPIDRRLYASTRPKSVKALRAQLTRRQRDVQGLGRVLEALHR